MTMRRVLVVDDDLDVRDVLCRHLVKEGFHSASAGSAADASRKLTQQQFHMILLDVTLPGIGGIDFCKVLRSSTQTASIPLVLMSAKLPRDVIRQLSESLRVPIYDKHDVLADLVSLMRDATRPSTARTREISIDRNRETVEIGGHRLPALSHRCFRLFCALADRSGPMKREEILSNVWPDSDNMSLVAVTIFRLRRSLAAFPDVQIIATGNGYHLVL